MGVEREALIRLLFYTGRQQQEEQADEDGSDSHALLNSLCADKTDQKASIRALRGVAPDISESCLAIYLLNRFYLQESNSKGQLKEEEIVSSSSSTLIPRVSLIYQTSNSFQLVFNDSFIDLSTWNR